MHDWKKRITKKKEIAENILKEKALILDRNSDFSKDHSDYLKNKLDEKIKGNTQKNRKAWIQLNKKYATNLLIRSNINEKESNFLAHLNCVEQGVWFGANYIDILIEFYNLENLDIELFSSDR